MAGEKGPSPDSIYLSVRDGRPRGMPSYRELLTHEQIWQLAGYVRSIGTYSAATSAPSRNDEMQSRAGGPKAFSLRAWAVIRASYEGIEV
jgi:cytochrome c oxidase cbb3-type subunit 3